MYTWGVVEKILDNSEEMAPLFSFNKRALKAYIDDKRIINILKSG